MKIADLQHTGAGIPAVGRTTLLRDALVEMTRKGLGVTAVVDPSNKLLGVFTDGDLRRALDHGVDVHKVPIHEVMTRNCKTVAANHLAAEALELMQRHKINALVVVDADRTVVGILNMHDLLRAGVV